MGRSAKPRSTHDTNLGRANCHTTHRKLQDAMDQGLMGPRGGAAGPGGGPGGVSMLPGGGGGGDGGDGSHINTSALSQEQLNLIQLQVRARLPSPVLCS
jgi:hypothetical protein